MRKFLIPLAAIAALTAAAAPAAAQSWRGGYDHSYSGGQQTTGYVDGLEWKINNAARQGRISWGEARNLKAELRQIQPLAYRVQTGRASAWEQRRLSQGVNRIESAVNTTRYSDRRYDRDDRYGRYERDDSYERDDDQRYRR